MTPPAPSAVFSSKWMSASARLEQGLLEAKSTWASCSGDSGEARLASLA